MTTHTKKQTASAFTRYGLRERSPVRFMVVHVNKYIGDYTGRYLAYAVVDREQANRTVSGPWSDLALAVQEAERLEREVR